MSDPKKILVIAPNWVGDTLFFLPAVAALKRRFPSAVMTLLAKKSLAALQQANPLFERVAVLPGGRVANFRFQWALRPERFDLAVVFPDSFSTALGAWLAGAQTRLGRAKQGRGLLLNRRLRLPDNDRTRHVSREYMDLAVEAGASPLEEDYKVRLPLSDESREEQARLFREAGLEEQGPLVGICPTSAFGPAKCWPPAYFAKLAESLRRKGKIPVLFGAPSEKAVLDEIDGASEKKFIRLTTTLPGLAACLSRMKAVVANDSGPLHLAAAMGVPVAGLYGPIDPKWSGPLAGKSRVFYTRIECSPCHQRICPLKHHKCLRDIAPETVFDGLIDLMK